MSTDLVTIGQNSTIISAIQKMSLKNVSCIVVIKNKLPVGIITERDLVNLISKKVDIYTTKLKSVMRSPVISVYENTEIPEVATLMVLNNLRRLLVIDALQNVIGIVTQTDIIKGLQAESFISVKKVYDVMSKSIVSVSPNDLLPKAIGLMARFKKSCVLVIEDGKLVGILTERNVTKAIAKGLLDKKIGDIMDASTITIKRDMNLYEASRIMEKNSLRSLPVIDNEGHLEGVITMTDIIKNLRFDYIETLKNMMKEKERFLVESETKYKALVEQSLEGIIIVQSGIVKFVNKAIVRTLGYEEEEMIGNEIYKFLYPESRELLLDCFNNIIEKNEFINTPIELHMIQKNNEEIYMETLLNPIVYEGSPSVVMTLRDITERVYQEMELKRLVITDDLTGLYNQRFLITQLLKEIERAKRHGRKLSLLFIDIDDFKKFNDLYGHWEGDFVLKKIGELIKKNIREIDMAFRYGGEEFVVLLPETSNKEAIEVAERIRLVIESHVFKTYSLDGAPEMVTKTVSIGVTELKEDDDMESFLKRADEGMYQAKLAGKNKVVCVF